MASGPRRPGDAPAPTWPRRASPADSAPPGPQPRWTTRIAPTLHAPAVARGALSPLAPYLTPDDLDDARLMVSELVTNAVLHADPSGPIELDLRVAGDAVVVSVADDGPGFDPSRVSGPTAERPGGRGIWIVRALARCVGVDPGHPFRLWFSLPREHRPSS